MSKLLIIFNIYFYSQKSFIDAEYWLNDFRNSDSSNKSIIFLIGNKQDLSDKRVVSIEEAIKFKDDHNLD